MIYKPRRKTEFELQAELYNTLKGLRYEVRGEVGAEFDGLGSRLDLVVFVNDHAAVIIEVKDTPHMEVVFGGKKTRQRLKYEMYGIPVLYYTPDFTEAEMVRKVHDALAEAGLAYEPTYSEPKQPARTSVEAQSVYEKTTRSKTFEERTAWAEAHMPPGDEDILLTRKLIDELRTNGSFTTATMHGLGFFRPPAKGWVSNLVGQSIPRQMYYDALVGKFYYAKGK